MTGSLRDVAARRWDAGRHLTVMAVCFGMTVVLTRLYLILTGYPKIGGGVYHIAHALFGGLALVIACVVVLLYANRGAMTTCAVLAGLGLGLFIDEIGKFITADNNYFFPLAAPLIYLAFLVVVLVARRAHREPPRGPHAQLLEVFDGLPAFVSGRMGEEQRRTLMAHLEEIRAGGEPHEVRDLAGGLEDCLRSYSRAGLATAQVNTRPTLGAAMHRMEDSLAPQRLLRPLLVVVVTAHALWSITRLFLTAAVFGGWHTQFGPLARLLDTGGVHGWRELVAWGFATAVEAASAILYTRSAIDWLRGNDRLGVRYAVTATVLALTVVNVLNSYFHQFTTVFTAVVEGLLLFGLLRYRARFLPDPAATTLEPERAPATDRTA